MLGKNPRPMLLTLDQLGQRYSRMPTEVCPELFQWLSPAQRLDIDSACMMFGTRYERLTSKMSKGKNPKPLYDPMVLLGLKKPKNQAKSDPRGMMRAAAGLPGVNVRRKLKPRPTPEVAKE